MLPTTGVAQSPPSTQGAVAADDISGLMAAKRFDEAIRAIDASLRQPRGGTAAVDRQALFLLKSECQMQLKRRDDAIRTLGQVKQEADRANDTKTSSQAVAITYLLQKSVNFQYKPGTLADKTPVNILDPDMRKVAYTALLADELALMERQQNDARTNRTLKPIMQLAENFPRTQAIERTASDNTSQTDVIARELSTWADTRITATLKDHSDRINQIAEQASRPSVPGTITSPRGRRNAPRSAQIGLDEAQTQELHSIIADCRTIPKAVNDFTRVFGESNNLPKRITEAKNIEDRANLALQGNYAAAQGGGTGSKRGAQNP